jgi:hypothetical protein
MKNIVFTLVLAMISSIATAQTDLSQLKESDKKEYLERVSKKMIKEMAPDYADDCKIVEISGPMEFTKETGKEISADEEYSIKFIGKKYYSVDYITKYIFMESEDIRHIIVRIWEHNGEPAWIYSDIGGGMGYDFFYVPYKDFIKTYRK